MVCLRFARLFKFYNLFLRSPRLLAILRYFSPHSCLDIIPNHKLISFLAKLLFSSKEKQVSLFVCLHDSIIVIMSREDVIKALLETPAADSDQAERITRIEQKLDLILSVIVVQQKDACEAVGVSPDTVRNRVLSGDTTILQRDGSRLNYLTLEQAGELKTRKKTRRR